MKLQTFKQFIIEGKFEKGTASIDDLIKKVSGKTIIFWDTETTGLDPKKDFIQVIEIAGIAIDSKTGKELGRYHKKSTLNQAVLDRIEIEKGKKSAIESAQEWKPGEKYQRDEVVIHNDEYWVVVNNTTVLEPNEDNLDWKHLKKKDIETRKSIEDLLVMTRYREKNTDFVAEKDMLIGFSDFVKKFKNPLIVAHNSRFDMYQLNSGLTKFDKSKKVRAEQIDSLSIAKNYLVPVMQQLAKTGDEKAIAGLEILKNGGKRILNNLGVLGQLFSVKTAGWHGGLADSAQLAGICSAMLQYLQDNIGVIKSFEKKQKKKR